MVEVRLHGALAKSFGKIWLLDISTPAEAVQAIEAGKRGFKRAIMALSRQGMVFRVRSKDHDYGEDDVGATLGKCNRIDIIPIIQGSSAGLRFIAGAVLVAVAAFVPGAAAFAPQLYAVGASLMLGAVVEWLTPVPKREAEDKKNLQSWSINGPTNTVEQGMPVPIIYGEVLTGGYTISAGIVASQVSPNDSVEPDVTIGGKLSVSAYAGNFGTKTVEVMASASTFNMAPPFSYDWNYTGFAEAESVTLVDSNKSTVRLRVTLVTTAENIDVLSAGTLELALTGREATGSTSAEPTTIQVTKSVPVEVHVSTYIWDGQGGA